MEKTERKMASKKKTNTLKRTLIKLQAEEWLAENFMLFNIPILRKTSRTANINTSY